MVKDILSISGYSGLFKLVSQAKNSVIVESLVDGKRMPAYATSKISALEDISIYTEDADVRLADLFVTIFEKSIEVDTKGDAAALKKKFEEILPDYDKDRVYVSDIKKVYAWYNLLTEKGLINEEVIAEYKAEQEKEKEEKVDKEENSEEAKK